MFNRRKAWLCVEKKEESLKCIRLTKTYCFQQECRRDSRNKERGGKLLGTVRTKASRYNNASFTKKISVIFSVLLLRAKRHAFLQN